MKPIGQLLQKPQEKPDRTSERGELLRLFTDKINSSRKGTKYRRLPIAAVGAKLAHLSVGDLYFLKSVCEDAERRGYSFAKRFWWELNPQKEYGNSARP